MDHIGIKVYVCYRISSQIHPKLHHTTVQLVCVFCILLLIFRAVDTILIIVGVLPMTRLGQLTRVNNLLPLFKLLIFLQLAVSLLAALERILEIPPYVTKQFFPPCSENISVASRDDFSTLLPRFGAAMNTVSNLPHKFSFGTISISLITAQNQVV